MRLIYIDESKDIQNDICAYSALCIHIKDWHQVFNNLIRFRISLRDHYNLAISFEMHASDFVAGRGKHLFNRINTDDRITIYRDFISVAVKCQNVRVLNAVGKLRSEQFKIFEWLVNRLDTMLRKEKSYGILICDEGDNEILTKMTRKMRKENLIPSKYSSERIDRKTQYIVEDPVFKKSHDSYFIQLVDFIVHAFLRFEYPLERKAFLKNIFLSLEPVLNKEASHRDEKKLGIIRIK